MKFFAIFAILAIFSATTYAQVADHDSLDKDINELQMAIQDSDEIEFFFGSLIGKAISGAAKIGSKIAGSAASKIAGGIGSLAKKGLSKVAGIGSKIASKGLSKVAEVGSKVASKGLSKFAGIGNKIASNGLSKVAEVGSKVASKGLSKVAGLASKLPEIGSKALDGIGKAAETASKVANTGKDIADLIKSLKELKGSGKQGGDQGDQGGLPGFQIPQGGYQPPAGGYQLPQGGYQLPAGGYQLPQGGYQLPPGGYQLPTGGYDLPAGDYQLPQYQFPEDTIPIEFPPVSFPPYMLDDDTIEAYSDTTIIVSEPRPFTGRPCQLPAWAFKPQTIGAGEVEAMKVGNTTGQIGEIVSKLGHMAHKAASIASRIIKGRPEQPIQKVEEAELDLMMCPGLGSGDTFAKALRVSAELNQKIRRNMAGTVQAIKNLKEKQLPTEEEELELELLATELYDSSVEAIQLNAYFKIVKDEQKKTTDKANVNDKVTEADENEFAFLEILF